MMRRYVAFDPPHDAGKQALPVFVRDGFAVLGLLVPPLWLAWHRLWVEAAVTLALLIGINGLAASGWVNPMVGMLSTLVGLFVALEGPAMHMAGLRRRGFVDVGAFTASDLEDAETRYAYASDDESTQDSVAPLPSPSPAIAAPAKPRPGPALGLFGYPERS